ncbi:hypothetical protein F2Q69_00053618 [Brassica cretica]|uniref:Uncharacterized protein n=1 Tax=Brassica cretica TaxID=69181 RepID=A0A8S9N862_BRACR|nr:hypothetical protein F2Q69_00053618 [Brassica cretica]
MASRTKSFLAIFLILNILFCTTISAYGNCGCPSPKPKPHPSHKPKPNPKPKPTPTPTPSPVTKKYVGEDKGVPPVGEETGVPPVITLDVDFTGEKTT